MGPSDFRGLLCLSVWLFAHLHSQFIQTTFYQSFVQIGACFNCSTPSKDKLSCLGEHYNPLSYYSLLLSTLLCDNHLLLRPTEKQSYRKRDKHTDRHPAGRQTDRQEIHTDRQTQTNRETQTDRQTDIQTDRQTYPHRQTDR